MIYDMLDSRHVRWIAKHYPALEEAFEWLGGMPSDVPEDVFRLARSGASVNVHSYDTKPVSECRWESHRQTVDLQYCITGGEIIEWLAEGTLQPLGDYAASNDTEHWAATTVSATRLRMIPRTFVLFMPHELHRPKVTDDDSRSVKKLVIKLDAAMLGL